MSENKTKPDHKNLKELEKTAKAIFDRAEAREKTGRDSFEAGWQATLEIMLLMMEKHLLEHPGRLLPMQIDGQDEWEFYLDVQEKLDLPPDACAVLITPSAFKDMPLPESGESKITSTPAWERNAYSIIISGCRDHTVVMQASLPGVESVGIDVHEDGKHLADYTYYTIEECLDDLTNVTWTYFEPRGDWTEEQIIRYTENWFVKTMDTSDWEDLRIHTEYSYVHHPELLGATPLEAVFKVIKATIPEEYDSLEKAIETANDLNRDFELGEPVITKEGILQDNEPECRALLGRIEVEIDQCLDMLESLKGVQFPRGNVEDEDYTLVFDQTAREVYEVITGRPYPRSVKVV
jgi:hypothetical protein